MLSEGDVVFRAGIILYAIYTGNHPGGSTGAQQLQWIMKVGPLHTGRHLHKRWRQRVGSLMFCLRGTCCAGRGLWALL